MEVFGNIKYNLNICIVNYDNEYDKLRGIILSIINDILNETEATLQRILF